MARRRKRAHPVRVFVVTLILVLIGGTVLLLQDDSVRHRAGEKTRQVLEEQAVKVGSEVVSQALGGNVTADEVQQALESVSEEDRNTILEIAENHQDTTAATEIASALQSGDTGKAEEIAESVLSEEEIRTLEGLYEKYRDQIPQN